MVKMYFSKDRLGWAVLLSVFASFIGTGRAVAQDPGLMGSHAVESAEYFLGYSHTTLPSFDVDIEFLGRVFYPSDAGPHPLIVIMHGRHDTLYDSSTLVPRIDWPPTASSPTVPSYIGHADLARHLASHGFVVSTISCNAIADGDFGVTGYRGQITRARLIQKHLAYLQTANQNASTELGNCLIGLSTWKKLDSWGIREEPKQY